jgi:hypothetical protein
LIRCSVETALLIDDLADDNIARKALYVASERLSQAMRPVAGKIYFYINKTIETNLTFSF